MRTALVLALALGAPNPGDLLEEGRRIQRERGEGGALDAIAAYRVALEADPGLALAWWELGWSLQVLNRLDEAVAAWDRVKELEPNYPELSTHYPALVQRQKQTSLLSKLPAAKMPAIDATPGTGPKVRWTAVGDIQLGMAWPETRAVLPPDDARDMFLHVQELWRGADVIFGNLETVLADGLPSTKCGPASTKCFAFRVPKAFSLGLRASGFNVLSIANNHAGDFGPEGRAQTMAALDAAGIQHSGPIGDIATLNVNDLSIALVAFSTGGGVYSVQDIATAQRVVAELAARHDILAVSFHAGAEGVSAAHVPGQVEHFFGENRGDVRAFARAVVDAGADLVLGHGPHLLRGMELYRGRLVAYSLGNFSTWETFNLSGPLGISVVLDVTLASNGVLDSAKLHPVRIIKPGRPTPDPTHEAIRLVRELSLSDFGQALFDESGVWQR